MAARAVCLVFEGDGVDLSVEMETGVGKTYTYIKTIHELYKKYGWMKYMIVVPSIAIRKGVHKCFKELEEHFMMDLINENGNLVDAFMGLGVYCSC